MSVGEEQDAEVALERPSSSMKASILSGKQKKIASLQSIQEKYGDSDADED